MENEKKLVVVALGRNAFGKTIPKQKENVKTAAEKIADIILAGYRVVITHSNGEQIGMLHTAMTEYSRLEPEFSVAPMSVCGALSQGYIGYDLQNGIREALLNRGIYKTVSTVITQVRVDPFDKAFTNPTKVIGRYMNRDEADAEVNKGNFVVEEEKGFRRVIPSPRPIDIYEIDAVRTLVDADQVVIACGGGGIPVMQQGTALKGASAIIEKDFTASRLGQMLGADEIIFLTNKDNLIVHKGTKEEMPLFEITVAEAGKYMEEGNFEKGLDLAKIEAAVEFVSAGNGKRAIITSMDKVMLAVKGRAGTIISG
nr:carbamate kinase [uncultured Catonella sp.]